MKDRFASHQLEPRLCETQKSKRQNVLNRILLAFFAMLFLPIGAWASYFGINTTNKETHAIESYEVTESTAADILGDGSHKITYDATSNILTLNGVDLEFIGNSEAAFIAMVDGDLQSLTVRLIGENKLTLGGLTCLFEGTNVSFITSATASGSLTITTADGWTGHLFDEYYTNNGVGVAYCDKLRMVDGQSTYTIQTVEPTGDSYGLTVAGTPVTSGNATDILGNGKVSFNATTIPKKLTFKDRNYINYPGHCINTTESLEIDVKASNAETTGALYLNSTGDGNYPFYSDDDVTIEFDAYFSGTIDGKNTKPFSEKCDYFFGTYSNDDGFQGPSLYFTNKGYTIAKCTDQWEVRINGNYIYDANHADVYGDGSVNVTEEDSETIKVTLNEANFKGPLTADYYETFIIDLTGVNYIKNTDESAKAIYRLNGAPGVLTFTGDGELRLKDVTIDDVDDVIAMDENLNSFDYSDNFTTGGWSKEYVTSGDNAPYLRIYKGSSTSYGLTVGGVAVTSANASNVLGDNETPTVIFTPANNTVSPATPATLTLNGATINGDITYSGTEDLTIAFSGTNSVSTSENYAIQFVGSDSELPNLAFSLTNGSTTGSLNLSSENCVINGFSDVDFGNLNLASASAQGVYYDSSEYGYNMAGYGGNPNNLTITTETYHPIWIYDPSLGQEASHTQLNSNKLSVAFGEGTISFDGNHTITMNNVDFNYEDNTLIVVGPGMEELTVNLVGTSTVRSGSIFLSLWATTPLTFTTDESNPGSLTAPTIVSWNNFENGQITYQNGLVFNFDESTYKGTISTTGDRLKIGDISINATGDITGDGITGTVHFDTSNNTLTLTGATIGDATAENNIQVFVDNLKVSINGSNTIFGNIIYEGNNIQSSTIQINKASDASTASLTTNNIEQFGACTWGDGLYISASDGEKSVDVGYEFEDGEGAFRSYYGEIATVTISTTPSYPLWINGIQATGGSVTGTGIAKIDFDEVSEWDITFTPSTNTLLLKNVNITISNDHIPAIISGLDKLTIQIEGSSYINYQGSYGGYIAKSTKSTAELTITADDDDAYLSTNNCVNPYVSTPFNGFSSVEYGGNLIYLPSTGSQYIQNMPSPYMSSVDGRLNISGGNDWITTYYTIDYVYDSEEMPDVKTAILYDPDNQPVISGSFETYPCTATAYFRYEYGGVTKTSQIVTGKLFEVADKTIVFNNTTNGSELGASDFELSPATENEGVSIQNIVDAYNESVISYDDNNDKYTIEGIGGCNVEVRLSIDDEASIQVLNPDVGDFITVLGKVTVVPDKPTIVKETGHDYLSTDKITITGISDDDDDLKIYYTWSDDVEVETYWYYNGSGSVSIYNPETKIPAQTGTLRAWVGYDTGGDGMYYTSEVVSEAFTVKTDISEYTVQGLATSATYTGAAIVPEFTVVDEKETTLASTNYTVSYQSVEIVAGDGAAGPSIKYTNVDEMVEVGSYKIVITGTGDNYGGSISKDFGITPKVTTFTVALTNPDEVITYDGTAKTPAVTVKATATATTSLTANTDYTVSYKKVGEGEALTDVTSMVDASSYKIIITGAGNYNGSTGSTTFTINKAQLTVTPDDKTYNVGDVITLTVSYDGFVNGENENVLTKAPIASCEANGTEPGIYTITASGGEAQNYEFVYGTGTLTINRALGIEFAANQTWATYYATENLTVPDGLKAYIVTAVDKTTGTVTASQVTYLPKNQAVLLENTGTSSSGFVAAPYTGATTTITTNLLKGSADAKAISTSNGSTVYILYYNVFKRATGGTIPARRAYLEINDAAPARLTIIHDGNATDINNIRTNETDDTWYSIDGRKLNGEPQRAGFYIKNGKKVYKK